MDPGSLLAADLPYALAAAGMSAINLYVLLRLFPKGGGVPTLARAFLVAFVLLASSLFWIGLPWALLYPSTYTWIFAIQLMMPPMTAPFLWMMAALYRAEERTIGAASWGWSGLAAGALLVNELFMAISFTIATGGSAADLGGLVAASLNSAWFAAPMLVTMGLLLWRAPAAAFERRALVGLAAASVVGPLLPVSELAAAIAMAAVMTGTFIVLFEEFGRRPHLEPSEFRTAIFVAAGFAVMGAGQLAAELGGGAGATLPFAVATFLVMLAEAWLLLRRGISRPENVPVAPEPWTRSAGRATTFLALGFVGDWLMAAVVLVAVGGAGALALPAISGAGGMSIAGFLFGGIVDVAAVTASPIFLGLMGLEMGTLVVRRILRTPVREQQARLGLALGSYGAYTVLAPALVVGWSRIPGTWPNIGAYGPMAPAALAAVLGSYAVFAGLVFLFGRRAYCSTLCPSGVMYGGTLGQTLIPTIRESPTPRRTVYGRGWRGAARVVALAAWVLFAVAVAASLYDSFEGGRLLVFGVDPAVFYAAGVWNFAWYIAFVGIPYLGMSPCRTWGFCTTGTFLGTVSVLGLYRKEVFDKETCRSCRTRDCGAACEVGLAEMPGALARDGWFRSVKCVGAHDCEAACPYGNLVSRDVRDVVRNRLGLPDRFAARRTAFFAGRDASPPMVPTPARPVVPPVAADAH